MSARSSSITRTCSRTRNGVGHIVFSPAQARHLARLLLRKADECKTMKAVRAVSSLLSLFIVIPIWYYLVHWLLVHSGAGDLQMFLFWVYLPVNFFVHVLHKLIESDGRSA